MNTRSIRQSLPTVLMILLTLGSVSQSWAATNMHDASGTNTQINNTNCNSPYDALQLNATRTPADGTPPFNGNFIEALSDVTYWYAYNNCWESTTWTSNGTGRKTAKISGLYQNPNATSINDFYLPTDRFIKLRNLAVDNVDLDYDNMALWFFTSATSASAPDLSLTLTNGSITGTSPPVAFDSRSHFNLTSTGDSAIKNWSQKVSIPNQTTLNVSGSGSKLTLFRDGKLHGSYPSDSMNFSSTDNTATIDGGTLKLDQSYVTFGKLSGLSGGQQLGRMQFQNNGRLELTGEATKLETGNVYFTNSSISLGFGIVTLNAINSLNLNSTQVDIADSGTVTSAGIDIQGNNTITLPKEYGLSSYSMSTGVVRIFPDSRLTLKGEGSFASDSRLAWEPATSAQQYGQIIIDDSANLVSTKGTFIVSPAAPITITRTSDSVYGRLIAKNDGTIELRGSTVVTQPFINHGEFVADTNGVIVVPAGTYAISGGAQGLIDIGGDGDLFIGNFASTLGATGILTTDNTVILENFSKLFLTIDPSARRNSQLRTSSLVSIANLAELSLGLVNDQALSNGTKIVLIDYGSLDGSFPRPRYFKGYANGSSFVLGLNRYQINYRDTDPGYGGAVTLTVIPMVTPTASLTPNPQTITGTVGSLITPSANMVPSNFGGTVTYSINPALPQGLSFDSGRGIISGVPTEALTGSSFTIRGIGSTSGDANATVNIAIAKGNQTINFGPAPNPIYSQGGSFAVSASATSSLPVSYTSLTPSTCSTSSSLVYITSAGTCTIAANQPGDSNYNAAPQATQNFGIAKAAQSPLTLFNNPANISVGGTSNLTTSGGNGTGAITYTSSTPSVCSVSGTMVTGSTTGTCTVTASQAGDANYNAISSNPINIQVGSGAQAQLYVSASPTTFNVNGTTSLSTAGGSGSGAVSYAVISGPCTMMGSNTVKGTASGQCQVVATKAADSSYNAATASPVTLTINQLSPSPLVLIASPSSVGFGGSSTLSTTGGIPGGPVSYSVTGPCSVDGNTLVGISAGLCTVIAQQAETSLYSGASSRPITVAVKERTTTFSYPRLTATIGQPFSLSPVTSGFTQPTFAVFYGNLPAGLTLNAATGIISGTPTGPVGTFDPVISVYENNAYDAAVAVISVQNAAPTPPPALIPTLSEWAKITMMFLMFLTVGWYRWRLKQR